MKDGELNKLAEQICNWIWGNICEMEELLESTRKDGVEHGISFCKTDEGFESTQKCSGTECTITLLRCPQDSKDIGSYHTHPSGVGVFSAADYLASQKREEGNMPFYQCLGTTVRGEKITNGKIPYTQNLIRCEKLNPGVIKEAQGATVEKISDMQENLEEADRLADKIKEKVKRGEDYMAEYKSHELAMTKFHETAREIGYIGSCKPPTIVNEWRRKTQVG